MIYADYAATTPVDRRVLDAMMPYLTDVFYNASSTHAAGLEAQRAVLKARMMVARQIGATTDEVLFTSGATESISLAVLGLFRKHGHGSRRKFVTCATEHMAMIDVARQVAEDGWDVYVLGVDASGRIDLDEVRAVVDERTLLLSVMTVNNETGVKQDLRELSNIAHEAGAFFMTDATQAYGKMPLNVDELDVDLMSFSAHKIYGPKGCGALYHRMNGRVCDMQPLQFGGGQEGGMRSGTYNVPGIVGMAEAGALALADIAEESARIAEMRDRFEAAMISEHGAEVNGGGTTRSYNISNITFPHVNAHQLQLQMEHVACSQCSACSSAKTTPSHVLTAMGRSVEETERSLRFSFGRYTTLAEVDELISSVRNAASAVLRREAEHHAT
jgi:cysteine desulfurase